MSSKIKRFTKIEKPCTNCFSPQYLKFNFAYIENTDDVEIKYKSQILNRMIALSTTSFLNVLQYPKEKGIEIEDKFKLGIEREIPKAFSARFPVSQYNNKLAIVRLYSNDNPVLGRILGVIIKNIFYVFFIDIGGKLYSH